MGLGAYMQALVPSRLSRCEVSIKEYISRLDIGRQDLRMHSLGTQVDNTLGRKTGVAAIVGQTKSMTEGQADWIRKSVANASW